MHFERIFLSKKHKILVILRYFYKMRLRIYNYNKISHSNKLQRLSNEATLYTFLFITCGLLRLWSTKFYAHIKVNCIKILIFNNRLHKLFVNISRLTITVTPPYINIADTSTHVFELIFHSQKFTCK